MAKIGYGNKILIEPNSNVYFFFNPNSELSEINEQTDDLLATEYFGTNITTFPGLEEDADGSRQRPRT